MKTREESDFVYSLTVEQRIVYWNLKKQIQLDAMKEGMRRAAEIKIPLPIKVSVIDDKIQAILTAAEQLTEKEL